MLIIIGIGIGIVGLGAGLFLGRYLTESEWFKHKKQERQLRKEAERQARLQGLQEMMPELKKIYMERELDKARNPDKYNKMKKFADAFAPTDSNKKFNNMFGDLNNDNFFNTEKILGKNQKYDNTFNPERLMGRDNNNNKRIQEGLQTNNDFFDTNKILGNQKKKKKDEYDVSKFI